VVTAAAVTAFAWFGPMGLSTASAAPECPDGALTTVVDDDGVSHEACVQVEAPAASVMSRPEQAPAGDRSLPHTGANGTLLVLAGVLVVAGSAAQVASRRRG
jgi:LPXTG-motif cell wall-anchored protein